MARKELKDIGFICTACQYTTSFVLDSRANTSGIRRRRECANCGRRFTTAEISVEEYSDLKERIFTLTKQVESFKTVIQIAKQYEF